MKVNLLIKLMNVLVKMIFLEQENLNLFINLVHTEM